MSRVLACRSPCDKLPYQKSVKSYLRKLRTHHPVSCRLSRAELEESKLQGLWKALDEDGSGFISTGEFGRFFRKGEAACAAAEEARRWKERLVADKSKIGQAVLADMDKRVGRDVTRALASIENCSSFCSRPPPIGAKDGCGNLWHQHALANIKSDSSLFQGPRVGAKDGCCNLWHRRAAENIENGSSLSQGPPPIGVKYGCCNLWHQRSCKH